MRITETILIFLITKMSFGQGEIDEIYNNNGTKVCDNSFERHIGKQ